MLQALLSAIVDLVLSVAWSAIVRLLGLENVVEIATAILGLSCIVVGSRCSCWATEDSALAVTSSWTVPAA
ncbi:hypothetical protein JQ581_30235 [Bradyrhizobium liaoningense]|uniref:hypothetical protein n=1 Tax=Bradyrhizobium liaoningense TaxID=43992 RepID=UPI001BA880EE|nr:hypothetical protein [Bradyrhizobium liaoningense]MBR0741219.1 hypothetical protein [Bradyrhizobium liaoningense]